MVKDNLERNSLCPPAVHTNTYVIKLKKAAYTIFEYVTHFLESENSDELAAV